MNTQFGAIDTRLAEMSEEMASMQGVLAELPALRELVDTKQDATAAGQHAEDARATVSEQLAALRNDKASKSIVSSLETSQHRLVEELLALQKLIGCKIDRVEVPLLDVASEKLQFLLDFQATADRRLDKDATEIANLTRAMHTKESKESHARAVATLQESLNKKVDGAFIKDQVLTALHRAEDDIARLKASEETLDKLLEDYHGQIEKVTLSEQGLSELRSEVSAVSAEYRTLSSALGHKVDFKAIDAIVFQNSEEVEKIARTYETRAAHEAKVQSAYLADVRNQLTDMQNYQNTVDAKLQTAMRFIDWYMDVKVQQQ